MLIRHLPAISAALAAAGWGDVGAASVHSLAGEYGAILVGAGDDADALWLVDVGPAGPHAWRTMTAEGVISRESTDAPAPRPGRVTPTIVPPDHLKALEVNTACSPADALLNDLRALATMYRHFAAIPSAISEIKRLRTLSANLRTSAEQLARVAHAAAALIVPHDCEEEPGFDGNDLMEWHAARKAAGLVPDAG